MGVDEDWISKSFGGGAVVAGRNESFGAFATTLDCESGDE